MNIDAFVELDDDFKTLEHDDFHDHTPIYCHLTWLPHLRVLWIRHRLSPTSQRHAENYHRDGRFVCGYCRNQQHKCILDRPQPPLWNRDKYSLSLVKWIGKIWKKENSHRGNLNWPSSEPSVPNVDKTRPFTSNTWIRWLFESDTMTRFVFDTAM